MGTEYQIGCASDKPPGKGLTVFNLKDKWVPLTRDAVMMLTGMLAWRNSLEKASDL